MYNPSLPALVTAPAVIACPVVGLVVPLTV